MFQLNELLQAKSYYQKNGVVVFNNIFSEELINSVSNRADELYSKASIRTKDTFWRKQKDSLFLEKYEPVKDKLDSSIDILDSLELKKIISCLLNDDKSPFLFKDKLIYKAPYQNGYPLHQDFNWWHSYNPEDVCTAVIPLDDVSEENGGIEFYLGCHKKCFLPEGQNRPLTEDEESVLDNYTSKIFNLKKGDLLVFHSLTPHFSARNMSNKWRRQLYPTFCSSRIGDVYSKQIKNQKELERQRKKGNIYEK